MGNKPDGALARFAPAAQGRPRSRPLKRSRGFALAVIVVFGAMAGSGAFVARSWLKEGPAPTVVQRQEAQKQTGHVVISRNNSELCDRYLFDNKTGAMKAVEPTLCHGKKQPDVNIVDQVTSFSSSWRGPK